MNKPDLLKRLFDVICTLCVLSAFSPIMALMAVLVKADTPGPFFFRSWRIGMDARPFRIFKFRTMIDGADRSGPSVTFKGDTRITRMGAFMRKFKLDELPQLFNVLRGEMSLVGPRPESLNYLPYYKGRFAPILSLAPGMTGLSWVMLAHKFDEEEMAIRKEWEKIYTEELLPRKLEVDLEYVRNKSFMLDLRIMVITANQLLNKFR